jgi:hypothetical protein
VPRLEHESRTSLNKERVTDDLWRRGAFLLGFELLLQLPVLCISACCPLCLTDVLLLAMLDTKVYETFIY